MIDPLAEIVSMLQPSLPFSKAASGSGNWRVDGDGDGSPFFALILEGSARLALNGQPGIELVENDFVLIPAACRFTMSSNAETTDDAQDPLRSRDSATKRDMVIQLVGPICAC
ncbi:cupin domain-containing protein [Agrobacterium tumefaciens]|uniref:cupin domain-containing protein n=1 Tax=Agrobacterium tumefaciens TaxID=358 RepID=UPI002FD9D97B